MNIPIKWLADYVALPKTQRELTDRLTSVGHMLDKVKTVAGDTVIDLELRGNRADMFGLIGTARDIAACFGVPLKLPSISKLPPTDPTSPLIKADKSVTGLITRYITIKLVVSVGPSPKWLVNRLQAYGLESINNVVDITNYVMLETSHPLHAFDYSKLAGGHLVLRTARPREKFATIQQGTTVKLSPRDIAIADSSSVQCLSIIGGLASKVTSTTTTIILETAVYNPAVSRRTARRHKIFTEGGNRHEKLQDPVELPFTLARAVYLLQQLASAKIGSQVSDYYPNPQRPLKLTFSLAEISRLGGLIIPTPTVIKLLTSLEFKILSQTKTDLVLQVPSFRTDVTSSADIVEEVIRIYGYDRVPDSNFNSELPKPATYPSYQIQETLRTHLTSLGLSEVITLSMFNPHLDPMAIKLVNPPDPNLAALRSSLIPNLHTYALRLLGRQTERIAIFEIGKIFANPKSPAEHLHAALAVAGTETDKNWLTSPKPVSIYYLKGILDSLAKLLGVANLNYQIEEKSGVFLAEFAIEPLLTKLPQFTAPYEVFPSTSPIIEDLNLTLTRPYTQLIASIYALSKLITDVRLMDKYGDKLTLRLTFLSPNKQLTKENIAPIRKKLMELV